MKTWIKLVLPYPDAGLSPNSRLHYRRKAELARDARQVALYSALSLGQKYSSRKDNMPLRIEFCPQDMRARDLDNAYASLKSALDGVAAALEINDKQFCPVTLTWGGTTKPGVVLLEIEA